MALKRGRKQSDQPTSRQITVLVCYDIGDDHRRRRVSELLEGLGPRVQQSVFECRVRGNSGVEELRRSLGRLIHPREDQVRVYNLGARMAAAVIVGNRELEEWRDFQIL